MLIMDQYTPLLSDLRDEISGIRAALGVDGLNAKLAEIDQRLADPSIWNDPAAQRQVLSQQSAIKGKLESLSALETGLSDVETMIEIAGESDDESLLPEVDEEFNKLRRKVRDYRLATLLSGEYDKNNAILTFHAGAGGTEAQDWAEMLLRMYKMYAASHGFKQKLLDSLDGDEAGIKSASLLIEGTNAYGYLKSEHGVHRLVRISPFDASGRRHTSFASLEVMPEISDDSDIELRDEDIKMDVFRSSGAGGQKVNKTSSAVRLTHIPTGIVVACQNERSQFQNKDVAMKMLKSKLLKIKEQEHLDRIEDIKGVEKEIAWGSQIRSYVFMPYTLVKDHRTSYEQGNIDAVMNGDLDGFINAYLVMRSKENSEDK